MQVSANFAFGNECAGQGGFDNCVLTLLGAELSPSIIKFHGDDLTDAFGVDGDELNSTLWPSLTATADEWSFTPGADNATGTWNYTPGPGDPEVRYWVANAGSTTNVFWVVDDSTLAAGQPCEVVASVSCLEEALAVTSGTWVSPQSDSLSHISFFDTTPVPLPAGVWLLLTAMGGLGFLKLRKRAA